MNAELIRKAMKLGYHIHWLQPSEVARASAIAIGAHNLSMCPQLATLRKGL